MATSADFIEGMFHMPGRHGPAPGHLRALAAAAHAKVLLSCQGECLRQCVAAAFLKRFLQSEAGAARKRTLLNDPVFVEAVRSMGVAGETKRGPPSAARTERSRAMLGNAALPLVMADRRQWSGTLPLSTDRFGVLHFPGTDWSIALLGRHNSKLEPLADTILELQLGPGEAALVSIARPGDTSHFTSQSILRMSRQTLCRLLLCSDAELTADDFEFGCPDVWPVVQLARHVFGTPVRFEAVGIENQEHVGTLGGIVEALWGAIRLNSEPIYDELCQFIYLVQAFELPALAQGRIGSFSFPTTPGNVGLNVSFNARGQPLLESLCFTWLAHELGHTRHYLIEDVASLHHQPLLEDPDDLVDTVATYGRDLPLRTVFQIPYVHLYEWVLLMDFLEADFAGLPWDITGDPVAVGEGISQEVHAAFDRLRSDSRLTCLGQAVLARMQCLAKTAEARWRPLASR